MIRISDLANAGIWTRPVTGSPRSDTAQDPSSWFSADTISAALRLSGDLSPGARGLSVEQHAARVLDCLCGDRDRDA